MTRPSVWWRRLIALAELAGDVEQQDIARRLGVSKSAVTGWKGGTEPNPDVLRSAAHAYHEFINVDTDELFRELKDVAYPLHRDNEEPKKRTPKRRT